MASSAKGNSSRTATAGAASAAAGGGTGAGHGQDEADSSPAQRRGQTGKNSLFNLFGGVRFGFQAKKDAEGRASSHSLLHDNRNERKGADWSVHATSASLADTAAIAPQFSHAQGDPAREHTFPSEQDGQSFIEFIDAFKRDAADQVRVCRWIHNLVDPHALSLGKSVKHIMGAFLNTLYCTC